MNHEFRLYTFVNFYLSSIQQGIQSAHVTHSLFVKYPIEAGCDLEGRLGSSILWDWAKNHKTMIVLNGGAGPDIRDAYEALTHLQVDLEGEILPFECFFEDESLDCMMTSFGIVVPRCYYDAKLIKNENGGQDVYVFDNEAIDDEGIHIVRTVYHPETSEYKFISILKSCGLAR